MELPVEIRVRRLKREEVFVMEVSLGGKEEKCEVLIDTGAQVSVVSLKEAERRRWCVTPRAGAGPISIVGFDVGAEGSRAEVIGVARVALEIGGEKIEVAFSVIDVDMYPPINFGEPGAA